MQAVAKIDFKPVGAGRFIARRNGKTAVKKIDMHISVLAVLFERGKFLVFGIKLFPACIPGRF
jgi:hypothetical protein